MLSTVSRPSSHVPRDWLKIKWFTWIVSSISAACFCSTWVEQKYFKAIFPISALSRCSLRIKKQNWDPVKREGDLYWRRHVIYVGSLHRFPPQRQQKDVLCSHHQSDDVLQEMQVGADTVSPSQTQQLSFCRSGWHLPYFCRTNAWGNSFNL